MQVGAPLDPGTGGSLAAAESDPSPRVTGPLGLGGGEPLSPLLDRDDTEARSAEARAAALEAAARDGGPDADAPDGDGPLRPLLDPAAAAARAQAKRERRAAEQGTPQPAAERAAEEARLAEGSGPAAEAATADEDDEVLAALEEEEPEIGLPRRVDEPAFVAPLERSAGTTWLATGKALLAKARAADAEVAFRRSLALEGVSVEALAGAGIAAQAQGHLNAARIMLLRARDIAPEDVDVNNALGLVLMGLNDWSGAYQAFRTAFIVSSGASEVAAANLENARIRAAHAASVVPRPDQGAVAFDLSRTGESEFLLHAPGTNAEAALPPEEPVRFEQFDEQAALAIAAGASPEEALAAAGQADGATGEAVLIDATLAEDPAAPPEGATAPLASGGNAQAEEGAAGAAIAPRRNAEAEAALPPELLAVIEDAGSALAPLEDTAVGDGVDAEGAAGAGDAPEGGEVAAFPDDRAEEPDGAIAAEPANEDDRGTRFNWTIATD
ncbi:MAG: hypothetical protein AAF371_05090 [Pseudomonadota bacterium]